MDIAFLVNNFPKISETFVTNQITALLDNGHDVEIFAFNRPQEGDPQRAIQEYDLLSRTHYMSSPETYIDGLQILSTVFPRLCFREDFPLQHVLGVLQNGKKAPRQFEVLENLLQAKRFDVYHAHFGPIGEAIRPAVESLDAPFVVSFYGQDISEYTKANPNAYDKVFERSDAVLSLSEEMRERLHDAGCPSRKINKQPVMVDTNEYPFRERGSPTDGPVELLTVARLVEKKGIQYAVEALAELEISRDFRFRIIGDGPQREIIENTVSTHGLEEQVDFLGYREHEEVKDWLNQSDIFVLPSVTAANGDREGTPTILLEAQAAGLPVVSTRHAGIPEIVDDGKTGYLVPERDVSLLAEALSSLIEQPEKWGVMGKAGRNLVKNRHDPETLVDSLETVYRDVLER